jgi:integrase
MAKKLKMVQHAPTREVVVPKVEVTFEQLEQLEDEDGPLPEYLEKEELAILLRAAKKRAADQTDPKKAFGARQLYRGIYLLAHTGLRIGEVCALDKKRWDFTNYDKRVACFTP